MKIHKINLINYKHFVKQEFNFKNGINAIIGENNAGKTSLLHAIAAVFNLPFGGIIESDFPSLLKDLPFTTRIDLSVLLTAQEWHELVRLRELDVPNTMQLGDVIWKKIIDFLVEKEVPIQFRLEIAVTKQPRRRLARGNIPIEEIIIFKIFNKELSDFLEPILSKDELKEIFSNINELQQKLNQNFQSIFAFYINRPQDFPFKPRIIFPYLGEIQKNEPYIGMLALQNDLRSDYKGALIRSQLYHLRKNDREKFHDFKNQMESNFPVVEDVNIKLDDFTGNFDLTLDTYNRDITIYGGGTQTFARIFSIIGLEDVSVILLDEPDSHLHASLADEFSSYLTNLAESKQILFTTHLPNLIDSFPVESIIGITLREKLAHIWWVREEKELLNLMDHMGLTPTNYQRALMGRAEVIVCVEGPTDIEILNAFIESITMPKTGDSRLSRYEYLPVGKLHSSDLNKIKNGILKKINKKVAYIRDRDEDTPDEISKLEKMASFPVHIWKYRQIESYLLDIEGLSKLLKSKLKENEYQDLEAQIEEIIEGEQNRQFSKLLLDYVDNRFREKLKSPEKDLNAHPNDSLSELTSKVGECIISRKAITYFKPSKDDVFQDPVEEYTSRWKKNAIYMINAKDVLTAIRREFKVNFQNKDIVNHLKSVPGEVDHVIRTFIFNQEFSQ